MLQSFVVQSFNLLPTWTAHLFVSSLSQRSSHDLARRQSRLTVSGEIVRADAISRSLNPPKKRISTTLLLRSSTSASAVRASYSATTSENCLLLTVSASSRATRRDPPLRF